MVKDPDTGKRLWCPNPKNDWQTANVPDLRIVAQELFDEHKVPSRRVATHIQISSDDRHMLSGLLRC